MTLSRSPSPRAEGGWSSPGLTNYASGSGRESPSDGARSNNANGNNVTWAGAKKKSEMVIGGHLAFPQNSGFFKRHMRNLSNNLPRFNISGDYGYAEKEKLGRGRWTAKDGTKLGRLRSFISTSWRKSRLRFLLVLACTLTLILWWTTRKFSVFNL